MLLPIEVLRPSILARVKNGANAVGLRINPGDIRPLVSIAFRTAERKVLTHRPAAMLFGNHVVDLKRPTMQHLWKQTILANVSGTSTDKFVKFLGHP